MMSKEVLFLCCLVIVGAGAAAAHELELLNDNLAGQEPVVVVEVHGMKFRAPFFNKTAEPLPAKVAEFHTKLVRDVMGPMREILERVFIEGHIYRLAGVISRTSLKFVKLAIDFFSQSAALQKKYNLPSDKQFQLYAVQVFPKLIRRSTEELSWASEEEIARYSSPSARIEFGEKLVKIVDGVQELVAQSPVGMYLDFNAITIDGTLLTDEGLEALRFLHKNGFSWMIRKLDWLCERIKNVQRISSISPEAVALKDVVSDDEVKSSTATKTLGSI